MVNTQVNIQLKDLISLGAHLGHNKKYYNPTMSTSLAGHRNGVDIINLEKTLISLRQVYKVLYQLSLKNGSLLTINTTPTLDTLVETCKTISRQKSLNGPWVHGALTNFVMVKTFLKTKKLSFLEKLPDLVLLLNVKRNEKVLKELNIVGIPVIAFADSDTNRKNITYPISSNDDSYSLLYFYLMYFSLCLRKFASMVEINSSKSIPERIPVFSKRYLKIKR